MLIESCFGSETKSKVGLIKSALILLFLGLMSLFGRLAFAVEFPEKPPDTDFYVDTAGSIKLKDGAEINKMALALLKERSIPLFVVTIPSLQQFDAGGETIESYARALFDEWGIGFKDFNYGILLLVSPGDRKARIELGADYGSSHDSAAQRIMDKLIVPRFKKGEFSKGILEGVGGLNAMARGERIPEPSRPWWLIPALILAAIGFGLVVYNLFKSGRSGWAWVLIALLAGLIFMLLRASANAGSGGGFGGGSSGGGGATGSW